MDILMKSEFDYFMVEREKIVDTIVSAGYAEDVTESVAAVIRRLAESAAGEIQHQTGSYISGHAWYTGIQNYVNAQRARGDFHREHMSGSLQFDSFATEDYGSWYIIGLNAPGSNMHNREYLVLLFEGMSMGNVTCAFTTDDIELADAVIMPRWARLHCENPNCQGVLECTDGYSLMTEQGVRYEPERGEYDMEGIYCPFCTSYSTGYPGELGPNNLGDAVYIEKPDAYEGDVMEPWHLVATLQIDD